ncbi:MAG TPA: carbohydrate binding domain-containing protein [Kiritimatiellia bacterium]|nr:carbohydrate binding domain-containing protein [Kiritimatiellia bacterium]
MRNLKRAIVSAALACLLAGGVAAQENEHAGWFPFVIPDLADEETAGTPIDLSFLNPEPAGSRGYLRPDGERIVNGRGEEVRLFGSNICDFHSMPPKANAPLMARRLKQLGFNFIRLHYFDFAKAPQGILNDDMQTLNPEKLDQFDWLVAQLKENGIYVDINLHICRPYPDQPEGLHRFGKGIDFIHDPYIESQKRYARDLIGHVNPYTRLSYAQDPAVAVIELNNENTVFSIWSELVGLPAAFSRPTAAKWNTWLKNKYGSTERLRDAWNGGASGPKGPEILANGDFSQKMRGWEFQRAGGAEVTTDVVADPANGHRCLRWAVAKPGTQDWHVQAYVKDLPVENGKTFTVSFRARAEGGKNLKLTTAIMMTKAPWLRVAGGVNAALKSSWSEYAVICPVANPDRIPLRLNFSTGTQSGTFEIADVSVREGVFPVAGLRGNERVEDAGVPLVGDTACPARTADFLSFLMDAEADYVAAMRRVLKEELGAKALVYCTQASYGGLAGLRREARHGDAIDMHCYPCHPHETKDAQGRNVRTVQNESMVGAAFGAIERAALWRVEGKPFLMTEFDLNPPNDHASENFPLLALLAAYQGWAGFAEYSWYNFQGGKQGHSRISSHFATTGHAGQMCMIPSMALLYRQGLVAPARARLLVTVPEKEIPSRLSENVWCGVPDLLGRFKGNVSDVWRCKAACRLAGSGEAALEGGTAQDPSAIRSDTGEIAFDRAEKGAESLQVNAPAARLLIGCVGGREFRLGDVRLKVGKGTLRDYADISLVALDGKPVADSRRLLLTAVARVENKGQKWDAKRTFVANDWGDGPTVAEPVLLTLALPGAGWRARALDGKGRPTAEVAMTQAQLTTDAAHGTLWYLIERP